MRLPGNLQEERLQGVEMTGYHYHGVPRDQLGTAGKPIPRYPVLWFSTILPLGS